ncbi:MAG: hypothetical protein GF350_06655, partial [Chitinivibrionales bacterium]|nr:hypothetical protein [Chitinivibrionales bacterium]
MSRGMPDVKGAVLCAVLMIACGCAPKYRTTVLIQMIEHQEKYFRSEVILPFEKEHNA